MYRIRERAGVPIRMFDIKDSELVVGLVAPIGCDRSVVESALASIFETRGYQYNSVRLSEQLPAFAEAMAVELSDSPYGEKVNSLMTAGNELRRRTSRGDVLALCAVHAVSQCRPEPDKWATESPKVPRFVHVFNSLKHPAEVQLLRQIYGPGFFLIGAFASRERRFRYLADSKKLTGEEANKLLDRDENERGQGDYGQQTRDTFHLADVFIDVEDYNKTEGELQRFFDLVFGGVFRTPTRDEFGMSIASTAALRSGALARQIGAALVNQHGDLVSVGHNDVPRAGGGLYCEEHHDDDRDLKRDGDTNTQQLRRIAQAAARDLVEAGLVDNADAAEEVLVDSDLRRVTEYGRTVHAEMEALLAAARTRADVRRSTLFTTTFPCHNCAKHAVAAGVRRIVYIEPYPKSEALSLHSDAIRLSNSMEDAGEAFGGKDHPVALSHFLGVSPRRFDDLFAMVRPDGRTIERKNDDGSIVTEPRPDETHPRLPMVPIAYPERERKAVAELDEIRKQIGVHSDEDD